MPERMTALRRLGYSAGSAGHIALDRIVTGILLYFYLPPPNRGLEAQVPEQTFFGALTAFGLAMILARAVDSVASPLIGHASDRSRSRLGRRRSFMIYGFLPMIALPLFAYWPPGAPGSIANVIWLTALLCLYYVASTLYMGPHEALLPEIASTDEDRARLSRMMSLVAFPVAGLLMAWPRGVDWGRDAGMDPTESIRWIVLTLTALSFVLCALPIFAIDERRFTRWTASELNLRESIVSALRNRPFLVFLLAHILFALATSMVFPALPYLATVLLGRSEGFAFDLAAALGIMLGVGYAVIPRLVGRFSSKGLMVGCFALFGLGAGSLGLLQPDVPGGPKDARNLFIAMTALGAMGLPLAGVSILPNVLLGQIIDDDARHTGAKRSAVFLGLVRTFDKWAYGLAAALLAFLFARFGKSAAEPLGVQLIGPIAGAVGLLSAFLFTRFPSSRPGDEESGD
jgi:GPH family glycoside/pentoside/hexuronide:cation symporter